MASGKMQFSAKLRLMERSKNKVNYFSIGNRNVLGQIQVDLAIPAFFSLTITSLAASLWLLSYLIPQRSTSFS